MSQLDAQAARAALEQSPELKAFVDKAWDLHADHATHVGATLLAQARTISSAEEGAAASAIELAEHVWLSHLHDAPGLGGFLQSIGALQPGSKPEQAAQRAAWAIKQLANAAPSDEAARAHTSANSTISTAEASLPEAARWRASQNVWSAMAARGQAAQATAELANTLPQALAHTEAAATRALAATCNNLATDLRLAKPPPTKGSALCALMLQAASASRALWAAVGTWVHVERADYQLARCHAVLGQGKEAVAHARACWAALQAHANEPQADAFERFFAREALAYAQAAARNKAAAEGEREHMSTECAAISEADQRAWAQEALGELDQHLAAA